MGGPSMNLLTEWQKVKAGEATSFRPKGNSMQGLINSGALVVVEPVAPEQLKLHDIVLVKVSGNVYLHKIIAIENDRFRIGNNKGRINGWASPHNIAGLCVSVDGQSRK